MTDTYFGTKQLKAVEMTRQEYIDYRGWKLPDDEDGTDAGFLVEYLDGGDSNHPEHDGYISWSPAAVFNAAYQPTTAMSFGHAIAAMKLGHKVARAGWNGKGMFVFIGATSDLKQVKSHNTVEDVELDVVNDFFVMRAADGSMVVGWLASQTDMLADDWGIV